MTRTAREQLQALVDYCDANRSVVEARWIVGRIESILATEPPAVTVRAGWVVKDRLGLWWCEQKPELFADGKWDIRSNNFYLWEQLITDPWPGKPNGGPECLLEVPAQ